MSEWVVLIWRSYEGNGDGDWIEVFSGPESEAIVRAAILKQQGEKVRLIKRGDL